MQASLKKIYNCQAMETKTSDDDIYFLLPLLLFFATATFSQFSSPQLKECRYHANLEMIY